MGVVTSTPFDTVALNDLDRFYRVADVIDRMRKLGDRTTSARQAVCDKLLEHTQHITEPMARTCRRCATGKEGDEDCNVSRTTRILTSIYLTAP